MYEYERCKILNSVFNYEVDIINVNCASANNQTLMPAIDLDATRKCQCILQVFESNNDLLFS